MPETKKQITKSAYPLRFWHEAGHTSHSHAPDYDIVMLFVQHTHFSLSPQIIIIRIIFSDGSRRIHALYVFIKT